MLDDQTFGGAHDGAHEPLPVLPALAVIALVGGVGVVALAGAWALATQPAPALLPALLLGVVAAASLVAAAVVAGRQVGLWLQQWLAPRGPGDDAP
jgi:hypothetical protein